MQSKKNHRLVLALTAALWSLAALPGRSVEVATKPVAAEPAEGVRLEGAALGEWTMDLDAALKLAAEKKAPILLDFTGSDWCGFCIQMDKKVFSKPEWKSYATAKLVLVTLDFPKDESKVPEKFRTRNEKLRDKYEIQGFPTYVILDSDGQTVLGRTGTEPTFAVSKFLRSVAGVLRRSAAGMVEVTRSLSEEDAKRYRDAVAEAAAAKSAMDKWIATRPQQTEENEVKYRGFVEKIEKLGEELGKLELRSAVRRVAGEKAAGYDAHFAAVEKLHADLVALEEEIGRTEEWLIVTDPQVSPENTKELEARMTAIEQKIAALKAPGK